MACQSQLRLAPPGHVIGIDLNTALQMAESMGFDPGLMAELLPWAEAGMVEGLGATDKNQPA